MVAVTSTDTAREHYEARDHFRQLGSCEARRYHMLLETKNAIVYGAAGSMGGAVARAFAREGATVFLAGRTLAKLDKVADEIRRAGGAAETAHVDAMDPAAVEAHVAGVAKTAGSVDISFNAISYSVVQNIP
jgi:NADP-dependent 3-hydroxy acid dehydrogenase YdfG